MQWGILLLRNRIQVVLTSTTPAKCNRMRQRANMPCLLNATICNNVLELVHSVAFSRVRVNKELYCWVGFEALPGGSRVELIFLVS